MSSDTQQFKVGDSVLIVGTAHDGALGTIIGISTSSEGVRYLVVFEDGKKSVFSAENLSYRR